MAPTHQLTLIQINDTHGYLEPHPELVWTAEGATFPDLGGYPRIASLLKASRRENPDGVIALDNGDTFHGTYPAVISRGESLLGPVNALKLDGMTAHWEFAWGPAHFQGLTRQINHPMLAINCYETASGKRPFTASTIIERAGLRVGVIGIAATIIDKSMPAHFSEGMRFTSGFDELPAEIARLRQGSKVDLIVVLSHLGFPQDVLLANTVSGIDILLSGHTHNRLEHPVRAGGAYIIQSGCHGSFVGRMDLSVTDGHIFDVRHALVPIDASITPDPTMQALVDETMRPYRATLNQIVGQTKVGLHRNYNLYSPMDDVLLAAIANVASVDIAFSNGWRYGAPIRPGPVTVNDLWNIIPTNPPVSTVTLTGAEIAAIMEENLERTFSGDPLGQMGGYLKRFRGLTIYGKLENPSGHRVERIFAGDAALALNREYKVAFVTAQGVPQKFGTGRAHLEIRAIDALRDYFGSDQTGLQEGLGRFIPV